MGVPAVSDQQAQWFEAGPSASPAEAQALRDFRSLLLPSPTTWAWSNLTFIDPSGRPSEIDVILLHRNGLFLLEFKGFHGTIEGNQQDWRLTAPTGAVRSTRNPFLNTQTKAQRLKSLLERLQGRQAGGGNQLPWIKAITVLHGRDSVVKLDPIARTNTYGLDGYNVAGVPPLSEMLKAAPADSRDMIDTPRAKEIVRLMGKAGFTPRPATLKIGQYVVDDPDPIREGNGWADWRAVHPVMRSEFRRIRVYDVPVDASAARRAEVERAAKREYMLAAGLGHPGVIAPQEILITERGPALVFPDDGDATPLAEYLTKNAATLDFRRRIELVRQIAEIVAYTHRNGVHHRGLTPAQVYVTGSGSKAPVVTIRDWQTGYQDTTETASMTRQALLAGATSLTDLVELDSLVYLAPEAFKAEHPNGVALDVYGLGAITYLILTDSPPADNIADLEDRLTRGGLDPTVHRDEIDAPFSAVVIRSTSPDVAERTPDVPAFLDELTAAEREGNEIRDLPPRQLTDPLEAQPSDMIADEIMVEERLGSGSTGLALLVTNEADEVSVIKVAHDASREPRLIAEAELLARLDHPRIVRLLQGPHTIGGRTCIEIEDAGRPTLGTRIEQEGRQNVEQLQNYGSDLFEAVNYLERVGVQHRDIKPDNLGIRADRRTERKPRLVLFDFSLANEPADQIRSGTRHYLDPFLGTASRPRYDSAAERFAVAVTLFQMATRQFPEWGDGASDPASIRDEVTLHPSWFEDQIAQPMIDFFRVALARDARDRHSDLATMASAWKRIFNELEGSAPATSDSDTQVRSAEDRDAAAQAANETTGLADAGLSVKAISALTRINVASIGELLAVPALQINQMPGVGVAVRREIQRRRRDWMARLNHQPIAEPETNVRGIEQVNARLAPKANGRNNAAVALAKALLTPGDTDADWPAWNELGERAELDGNQREDARTQLMKYWSGSGLVDDLRLEIIASLEVDGGIATISQCARKLLAIRGSNAEGQQRLRNALTLVRVAVETDQATDQLMTTSRPSDDQAVLIALTAVDPSLESDTVPADPLARTRAVRELAAIVAQAVEDQETPLRPMPALSLVTDNPASEATGIADPVRRLRLAADASPTAAVSTRGELYRRGLAPEHSVAAVLTGNHGLPVMSDDRLRDNVAARFPQAAALPARPALDALVSAASAGMEWNGSAYTRTSAASDSLLAATRLGSTADFKTQEFDAFHEQLEASIRTNGVLLLAVEPRSLARAPAALKARYGVEPFNVTAKLITAMRSAAEDMNIDWTFLLKVDALDAGSADRKQLAKLVDRALDAIWHPVVDGTQPLLLTDIAPLARYDSLDRIERLTDLAIARPAARWILVPRQLSAGPPTLEGQPVPLGAAGWTDLPPSLVGRPRAAAG